MSINYKTSLNSEQYQAVTAIEGPLLIVAGAGSGKTRVITYRIAYMLEHGIPQKSILALTFTNKAAREMSERLRALTGRKLQNLTVSTFHSFGVHILKKHIGLLGYRDNFTIYDQSDQKELLRTVAAELRINTANLDYGKLQNLISAIKTGRREWDEYSEAYSGLYREYHEHLKIYNAVDFDDLIVLPKKIFLDFPPVLNEYQLQYRYILVDEFQDTSLLQYEFVRLLGSKVKNICVVGDDDQSIYSWRGANFENLIRFENDFPDVQEIKLERNYRSTDTILQAANILISNNKNRKHKNLWTGLLGGTSIRLAYPEDEHREGEYVAQMIKSLSVKEDLKYHDFGVLLRTNSLCRSLETAFRVENIPYRITGGTSLYQRKEVKDIIAYLRTCANPDDDQSFLRCLNTPRRGIGKKTLSTINDTANRLSSSLHHAAQALCSSPQSPLSDRLKGDLSSFLDFISDFRSRLLGKKNLSKTLEALVEEIDYWGYLVQDFHKSPQIAKYRYENIKYFIDYLHQWESDPDNPDPSIYTFLHRITLVSQDEDEDEEKGGKVNLMTIHSAKGLEFEVVFLAGVEDDIIPHSRSIDENPENIEEERRLFYVAITRAKQFLYMTSCRTRTVMRVRKECSPSPFLEEIPESIIEYSDEDDSFESEDERNPFDLVRNRLTGDG